MQLGELAGLDPFPWQRFFCEHALGQHVEPNGEWRWAAFEVLLLVSRQNGKGTCLELLELLCLFDYGLNVYHTAHRYETSLKAANRLLLLINRTPALAKRVRRVDRKPHKVRIELESGAFIDFIVRTGGAGRGYDDGNVLVFDEALVLDPLMIEAILPGLSTREHPLVVYASSAGLSSSAQLRALRARMEARSATLAGFDWSVDPVAASRPGFDPLAVDVVAQSNPSLGGLISMDYVRGEFDALTTKEPTDDDPDPLQGWRRERLGIFDEPPSASKRVIPLVSWQAREDPLRLPPAGQVVLGVAAAWPDGAWSSIVAVGRRPDGDRVVKLLERRAGTDWLLSRARELSADRGGVPVAVDAAGPAGGLPAEAESRGETFRSIRWLTPSPRELAHASTDLLNAVTGPSADLWHYGQQELVDATVAGRRWVGDLWLLSRRGGVDISPLEATVLALWALDQAPPPPPTPLGVAVELDAFRGAETADLAEIGF